MTSTTVAATVAANDSGHGGHDGRGRGGAQCRLRFLFVAIFDGIVEISLGGLEGCLYRAVTVLLDRITAHPALG